jgi:DNA-binding MarR family transcriptional regulator
MKTIDRNTIYFNWISRPGDVLLKTMAANIAKVTQAEYETLADLRYSLRQFLHFSEEAARAGGLSPQQHQALLAIKGFPGGGRVTIGQLAERLQIRHHSATGLADRLASRKFVERHHASADRRQVQLSLTARGDKMLEKLSAAHKSQLRRLGPRIEALLQRLRS